METPDNGNPLPFMETIFFAKGGLHKWLVGVLNFLSEAQFLSFAKYAVAKIQ
jgi:hypothetical protein